MRDGEVGRVRCRSGAVMRGYWHDDARTAEVLDADGWLTIGDMGVLDERGYLTLVGRKSEMYIRGGYNVYPAEVERVLEGRPEVAQVAVLGIPDRVLGEIGTAFVVAAAGQQPELDALRAHVRSALADYKAPDRLVVSTELPVTTMGKVDKRALARVGVSTVGRMASSHDKSTLEFPYSRTVGPVVGAFLAGLREHRIVGIRDPRRQGAGSAARVRPEHG